MDMKQHYLDSAVCWSKNALSLLILFCFFKIEINYEHNWYVIRVIYQISHANNCYHMSNGRKNIFGLRKDKLSVWSKYMMGKKYWVSRNNQNKSVSGPRNCTILVISECQSILLWIQKSPKWCPFWNQLLFKKMKEEIRKFNNSIIMQCLCTKYHQVFHYQIIILQL